MYVYIYLYTATSHLCSFCHPSLATSGASLHWLKSFQELWLRSALKLQKRLAAGSWTNPKNGGFHMMKNQQERFFNIFQSETSLKTCRFLLKNLSLLPVQHASTYFNPWNWSNQPSTFLQFYPQSLWPAIDSPNQMEKQLPGRTIEGASPSWTSTCCSNSARNCWWIVVYLRENNRDYSQYLPSFVQRRQITLKLQMAGVACAFTWWYFE